jgi:UDP-glucose 4-epimerase
MDLAEGHLAALNYLSPQHLAFSLGTGQGHSVREMIKTFLITHNSQPSSAAA